MNQQELEFLIVEAMGLLHKRIDMLRHGFSIQETDLTEIRDLLVKAEDYMQTREKTSGRRDRLDK